MDHMALQGAGEKCASRMLNCFTYLTHECMHQLVRATKTDSEASYSPITAQVMDCHLSTCKVRMKGSSLVKVVYLHLSVVITTEVDHLIVSTSPCNYSTGGVLSYSPTGSDLRSGIPILFVRY